MGGCGRTEGISVYNLTVEDDHTYFVSSQTGDGAVWVHNVNPLVIICPPVLIGVGAWGVCDTLCAGLSLL